MEATIPAPAPPEVERPLQHPTGRSADGRAKYVFLLPAMIYLLLLGVFPLLFSLFLVFSRWQAGMLLSDIEFVGLANIRRLMGDERFWDSLRVTLTYVGVVSLVELVLGFIIALALQGVSRGKNFLRGALALPMLLTPIAVSFTWKMLFDYNKGPLNFFLDALGFERIAWLAGQNSALLSLALVDIWQWTPFIIVAALAALESLPTELYEAATVDGASPWQLLIQITLPLVQPYLVAIVLLRAIDAFKVFDTVYVLTGGGPGTATETLTFYAYVAGFRTFNMGFTSTVAWALVILMTLVFAIYLKVFRRIDAEEA
jgi:multiple sugar transport system permease protein